MLRFVPEHRKKDVIYFNPSDTSFPLGFNPIEHVPAEQRHIVSSGLMGVFKKIWPDVWSARMEYLLMNTILALLEIPDATLLGINRMLGEKEFRKWIVSQLTDQTVRAFWENEFAKYTDKFMTEAIAPIQNKVGQFVSNPLIRNIVGQKVSTFSIREAMDEGKIIIMNLSKGRIGEENSRLLGQMLITKIYLAAMSRVDIVDENKRQDFYLYVDELQNFASESFASILSEARKYRLNLIIAHQYITQMEEVVRDAVFGNVGTIISFRIGAFDAEYMEKEFEPYFMQTDLVNLDKYNAYVKLMINGVTSQPFSMETIPPVAETYNSKEKVIAVSRERYGNKREDIEEKIARWSGFAFEGAAEESHKEPAEQKYREQKRQQPIFAQASTFAKATADNSAEKQKPAFNSITGEAIIDTPKSKPAELEDIVIAPPTNEVITDLAGLLGKKSDADISPPHMRGSERGSLTTTTDREKTRPQLYPAICSSCGKHTEVPFKPDPEKEEFCKECYDKRKQTPTSLKELRGAGKNSPAVAKETTTVPPKQVLIAPTRPKPPAFTPPRPPKL